MLKIRYTTARSPRGDVFIAVTDVGVCWLNLEYIDEHRLLSQVGEAVSISRAVSDLELLESKLSRYFQGENVELDDPLDLRGTTPFQQEIWSVVAQIPYGQTRSYRWVAERIGRPQACRGVGRALAQNPVPIFIPCHRVINNDGRLGGFSAGVDWKKTLLEIEGVQPSLDLRIVHEERVT